MKYRILIAIVAILVLFSCITFSSAPKVEKEDITRTAQKKFDKILEDEKISGTVYAVCGGEVIYDKSMGDAAKDVKNSSDTVYCVASVTKQFTAASIMLLYEQGKLGLDDTLDKYFPDYKYGKNVTIEQVLSQRSGIPDYSIDIYDKKAYATFDGDESMKNAVEVLEENSGKKNRELIRNGILAHALIFKPGEKYDYSDSNYALLAEIVAKVSGMSEHDFVRQNIFEPLGMKRSAFFDDYDFGDDIVIAQPDHEEFEYDYLEYYGVEYGCGDIMMSPKDLYKWYRGLFSGLVVSKSSLELMTTNYSAKDEQGYGFGLMISDKGNTKVAYHYGWIPSFYSVVFYVPEIDYFGCVLTNRTAGNPQTIGAKMTTEFGKLKNVKITDIS